jgi:hypothetical protein
MILSVAAHELALEPERARAEPHFRSRNTIELSRARLVGSPIGLEKKLEAREPARARSGSARLGEAREPK